LFTVAPLLHRWIHLNQRTQPGIVVDTEQQVVGAGFGRDQRAVIGKQYRFGGGRQMEHVKTMLMPECQVDSAPRGNERCCVISDTRVICHIVRASQSRCIRPHGTFVFAMGADWERRLSEDSLECLLIVH
jgi:hypothetical protein